MLFTAEHGPARVDVRPYMPWLALDSETSGTGGLGEGLRTDFVAVPGRRYAIYVYVWLETNGGAAGGNGPIGYSSIEIDASVPFVWAQETLL